MWNVRDHIPLQQFTIQSHRGAGVLSPENSVEAFEIAWDLGTVPEADLRTTEDGVIVAFHDGDFRRILPDAPAELQAESIQNLTYAEVCKLDIGSWKGPEHAEQRVPRLLDIYQILTNHPQRRLYVDIKNVDLEQLARESKPVHKQLILASTDYDVIKRWKTLAPQSSTLHWMGGSEAKLSSRIDQLRKTTFADIDQLQIHVRFDEDGHIRPSEKFLLKLGVELRSHGILFQALPWDKNDPTAFERLLDLGVASFATDYPDVAMETVRSYYSRNN